MRELVTQIQTAAIDKNVGVTDLLRRALIVADRIEQTEDIRWIRLELSGYPANDDDIPIYRAVRGRVEACDALGRWGPVNFEDREIEETASTVKTKQPIAEIEAMADGPSGIFRFDTSPTVAKYLDGAVTARVLIDQSRLRGIVEAVRNRVLMWALELTQRSTEENAPVNPGSTSDVRRENQSEDAPTAVISYARGQDDNKVLQLAQQLRRDGIACELDQFHQFFPVGLDVWMERQVRDSRWVLIVASEVYRRRTEGHEESGNGLGVIWEYGHVRKSLYAAGGLNERFVPIGFGKGCRKFVPADLTNSVYFDVEDKGEYESLIRLLTKQPAIVPEPIGAIRELPPVQPAVIERDVESRVSRSTEHEGNNFSGTRRGGAPPPRLYLKVSIVHPAIFATSTTPVRKIGSYRLGVKVWNKGRGAANKVRVAMTGTNHVTRLGTIAPGDDPRTFEWSLEDQEAYLASSARPTVTVEYLDDDGVAYRQSGPLMAKGLRD